MKVTVKIFNDGTGLVLPAFYTFTCQKYTRAYLGETFEFLRLLPSLNLEKKWGCMLIRACTLNRTNSVSQNCARTKSNTCWNCLIAMNPLTVSYTVYHLIVFFLHNPKVIPV